MGHRRGYRHPGRRSAGDIERCEPEPLNGRPDRLPRDSAGGGLESLGGALLGGFAIGLVQALVQASRVVEVRNSTEIAPYILLLVVLLIRPQGLFGQKRNERV